MKYRTLMFVIFLNSLLGCLQAKPQPHLRVLLIPLDDRPPCLQFPQRMGQIGNVELVSPPRVLLGRFTQFGKSEEIIAWIGQQDLQKFDAAIVSMDMLAYGGLVASRVHATPMAQAMSRLEIVKELRKKSPKMKMYGSSVIMRLAPTADGKNEAYREKLSKWAEISPYNEEKNNTTQLEKEIPAEALANYKQARERNLSLNRLAVELTKSNVFDYLILSQDDAKPRGIHVRDREALIELVNAEKLNEKVAVQPGADEVSMLLLARAVSDKYQYHPKVKAIYSTEAVANQVMPFEDRPLRKTVSFHLKAVGAQEVEDVRQAEIVFFVFATRFEEGSAKKFANEMVDFMKNNPKKGVIIADIDPKGDVQGGDILFTKTLIEYRIFSKLYGYASWNTAGNVIGTALPHGIIYGMAKLMRSPKKEMEAMSKAQSWFTINRLLDDFAYHSIVRPAANQMIRQKGWNPYRLTDEQTTFVEAYCLKGVQDYTQSEKLRFLTIGLTNLTFDLPWNRTFEAEIDFLFKK